ncbi:hypothetical protein BJ138DRAFT_1119233 [Hygrophoropsis aurantiaca]|uniref:Uncharacterized protein n=1 Tax=Hygrophoropsis aurantiaca TaxID=72124 RepID=A0ACB7ZWA7_9AGAM|nr:hypothetical protein BJ138DRAFT_1119233 [Hygrophoropsis aurantiaca]
MTNKRTKEAGNRQREATLRWLARPGVLDAQRKKARERTARNRARSKTISKACAAQQDSPHPSDAAQSHVPDSNAPDSPRSSLEPSRTPTTHIPPIRLSLIRFQVRQWQIGWGPEAAWGKLFSDDVQCAQQQGSAEIDHFFSGCEYHVKEGRAILSQLRLFIQAPRNDDLLTVIDEIIQAYDLSMEVLSELRFFEVKLDQYAPVVSSERLSKIRHYNSTM